MPSVYNSTDSSVKEDDNGRNKKKFEEERIRRAIQDENDILKEEFDRQLDDIRGLWNPNPRIGKLVLNRINIEKSALYLHPDKYLQNIASRKELTEDEIKQLRRTKRKIEGEKMYNNLISKVTPIDSNLNNEEYGNNMTSNKGTDKFESNIDRFLEIPKQVNDTKLFPDDKWISEEDVEWDKSIEPIEELNRYRSTNRYIIPEDEYKSPRMIQISYAKDDSIQKLNQIEILDPLTESFKLPKILKNDAKFKRINIPKIDRQLFSNLNSMLIRSKSQEDKEYKEAKIKKLQNLTEDKIDDQTPMSSAIDIEIMKNPKPKVNKKLFKKETLIAKEEELEFRRK